MQAMLRQAAYSARQHLILDPFPKVPDPKNASRFVFSDAEGGRDIDGLREVLNILPCPMRLSAAADWTKLAKEAHELAWKVIRW